MSEAMHSGSGRRVLVTGANGFIGRRLVRTMLSSAAFAFDELVLLDLRFADQHSDPRVQAVSGSVADQALLAGLFRRPFDVIFHMACIAGGQAEEDFELSYRVNLLATMQLLELARAQPVVPVLLYTSSIGVYGRLPELVTDDTPARPTWSYGTHKAIGELLMTDYTRKGFVDARTLRLPGIVARPADPSGAVSAFLSDLIRTLAAGQPYVCPVSAAATSWWMSVECCVSNLLHGAALPAADLRGDRVWMLPPLRASVGEVVAAISRVYRVAAEDLVRYEPVAAVEERFGKLPKAHFEQSEGLGFRHDGSTDALVRRALDIGYAV